MNPFTGNACITILVIAFSTASPAQQSGYADAVLGRWDLTIHGDDGDYPSWLEVRLRTENQLMAEFVGQFGSMRHATAVEFEGDRLEVRIPVQYEGPEGNLSFTGRIDGKRLLGVTRSMDGEVVRWTGVRAPALLRTTAPNWADPVPMISNDEQSGWTTRSNTHTKY